MTPERLEQLRLAFQTLFGVSLEKGAKEVRFLTRNYVSMAVMNPHLQKAAITHGVPISSTTVRMDERDFAMVTFFALIGLVDAMGEDALNEPEPKTAQQLAAEWGKKS